MIFYLVSRGLFKYRFNQGRSGDYIGLWCGLDRCFIKRELWAGKWLLA